MRSDKQLDGKGAGTKTGRVVLALFNERRSMGGGCGKPQEKWQDLVAVKNSKRV